jgi:hypothetical protein
MSRTLLPWLAVAFLVCGIDARANDAPGEPADRAATVADQPADGTPAEEESEEDAEERRILEQVMKEHAAEQASVASIRETADFQECRAIEPPTGSGKVLAFHPLSDGGLVIATGAGQGYGEQSVAGVLASIVGLAGGDQPKPPTNALMWLDADALVAKSWQDALAGKAISIPGWQYRLLVFVIRSLPRSVVRSLGMNLRRKQRK